MVVKVQVSLATTESEPQVLIYDRSRQYEYVGPMTPELLALVRSRPRAYFEASVERGLFCIGRELPEQGW